MIRFSLKVQSRQIFFVSLIFLTLFLTGAIIVIGNGEEQSHIASRENEASSPDSGEPAGMLTDLLDSLPGRLSWSRRERGLSGPEETAPESLYPISLPSVSELNLVFLNVSPQTRKELSVKFPGNSLVIPDGSPEVQKMAIDRLDSENRSYQVIADKMALRRASDSEIHSFFDYLRKIRNDKIQLLEFTLQNESTTGRREQLRREIVMERGRLSTCDNAEHDALAAIAQQ